MTAPVVLAVLVVVVLAVVLGVRIVKHDGLAVPAPASLNGSGPR